MGFNKDEAVKKIQDSDNSEFEVFTKEEHTTYLDNYKKSEVENEIGDRVRKVHQNYDADILQLTGKSRPADQQGNSTEFLKTIIGDAKSNETKITELTAEVSDLKEKIKSGAGDEQLKKDLAEAQDNLATVKKLYDDEKETWGKEKGSLESSHQRSGMENILDRALIGIKFKDGISESVVKIVVDSVKNELLETAAMADGTMIFKDKEGKTLINKDNAMNPFTADEMFRSKLKDIIDEGRVIAGTGVKPEIKTDKDGNKTINYSPSDAVKTKDDLHKDLASKGLVQGSEEYNLAWEKYSGDYGYK